MSLKNNNPGFTKNLEDVIKEARENILALDYKSLPISDYSKRYWGTYLNKLDYSLKVCAFIVRSSVEKSNKNPGNITFIDNGGGIGILSFFAKLAGIKTVIYNDIYDIAVKDATVLLEALGVKMDHFITGDISGISNYLVKNKIKCDIVASQNVIEHIYDLDDYFSKLETLTEGPLTLFFCTSANLHNPLVSLYTKRIHRVAEFKMRKPAWGAKERDQLLPYLLIRKNIIKEHFPTLSEKEQNELAARSRGLIKEDIIKTIENYKLTGKFPEYPRHPTNTCDPLTGNWSEHLVSSGEYRRLFEKNGFRFEISGGFYNTHYKISILNLISRCINFFIRLFNMKVLFLSPFIALCGKRD